MVLLLWLWLTNLALLIGAELDAELERDRQLQAGIAAEETIQLPPRDTRNIDKAEDKERSDIEDGRAIREDAESHSSGHSAPAASRSSYVGQSVLEGRQLVTRSAAAPRMPSAAAPRPVATPSRSRSSAWSSDSRPPPSTARAVRDDASAATYS